MAMRNLEVIVTVVDKASQPLDNVSRKVRGTGDAAKKANTDFTQFNRTLFATTAFVGTFVKLFSSLTNAFDQGSELDRLSTQFERVLGPKGNLFNAISGITDASIDKFEAMRQGISLRSLGIAKSTEQVADIVAKAGVAAKLAGADSAEGIKNYSEFLKDGNVSHLQFLNLISQTNPALQAQMAILSKAGGVMGGVVSTQARLALGQSLLNAAVKGNLKGFRDLRDIVLDAKTNFTLFKQELGRLLLTALAPLVDKFSQFLLKLSITIDDVRKNNKHLVFLIKTVVLLTTAVLGLAGALGTLRLASMALGSLGFGLPRLMFLLTAMSTLFLGVTNRVDKFTEKLKVFGAFVKGVYQLVSSLNTKTGIAQIDDDIKELLEKNGIMAFAQNVARAISVVKTVIKDMVDAFKWASKQIDNIFGGIGRRFIDMVSKFKEPWSNWWVNESATPVEKFVRNFAVIGSTVGTIVTGMIIKGLLSKLGGAFSKIPIIGSLFGGGRNSGPKGTKSDPIYTKDADKIGTGLAGGLFGRFAPGAITESIVKYFKNFIMGLVFTFESSGLSGVMAGLGRIVMGVVSKFAAAAVFVAAIIGAFEGIWNTASEWKQFFGGIIDIAKAVTDITINFIKSNKILNWIVTSIGNIAEGLFKTGKFLLVDGPIKLFGMIREGWRLIFELLGSMLGPLGKKMSDFARELSPDTFKAPETTGLLPPPKEKDLLSTAGVPGEKTSITNLPQDVEANADTIDMLGEQLKNVSGAQRKQMQQSVEDALRTDSESGKNLSPAEMARITANSMTKALDSSNVLQNIEGNTRKAGSPNNSTRRGL